MKTKLHCSLVLGGFVVAMVTRCVGCGCFQEDDDRAVKEIQEEAHRERLEQGHVLLSLSSVLCVKRGNAIVPRLACPDVVRFVATYKATKYVFVFAGYEGDKLIGAPSPQKSKPANKNRR